MALMLAIWRPQPNWMPRKPNDMFHICQKLSRGFSIRFSADESLARPGRSLRGSAIRPSGADTDQARHAVEAGVEAHDAGDALALHDGDMQRVAGREQRRAQNELTGPLHIGPLDRHDLVHDSQDRVEGRL